MHSAWAVFYILLWPDRSYHNFPYYLINNTICGQTLLNIECMLEFSLHILSGTFYILRRIQRDFVISVRKSSCKIPVIVVRFKWNSNFLDKCSKYVEMYFKKSCPVRAELFHAEGWTGVRRGLRTVDRQTDMKLISAFGKFAKGSKTHLFWPKSFSLNFVCISENAAFMPL